VPKVSVIIPAFNTSDYICRAIDGVLAQTYTDFEIIVVDDGSTDRLVAVLKAYRDRIKYFYQENKGPSAARNNGINRAEGEYIAFLDGDDIWCPENLEKKIKYLEGNPTVSVVCSDFEVFGDASHPSSFNHRGLFPDRKRGEEFIISDTLALLIGQAFMFSSTTLLRRSSFEKYGVFEMEISEDYDLFLRMAQGGDFGCIHEILVRKRDHKQNLSKGIDNNLSSRIDALSRLINRGVDSRYQPMIAKRIADSNFSWAYRLSKDRRFKESREKAMNCLKNGVNYKALKLILKSYILAFEEKNV